MLKINSWQHIYVCQIMSVLFKFTFLLFLDRICHDVNFDDGEILQRLARKGRTMTPCRMNRKTFELIDVPTSLHPQPPSSILILSP